MRIYFGGAEIGSHRTLLDEIGVSHVSMSYMGLRRRVKFSRPWLIKDKFPSYVSVFLDSGAYTVNADENIETAEIEEINEHYQDFVNANLDRVDLVSEFDAMAMGLDWIEEQREAFWSTIPSEKFMAIWHPVWGIPYLHEMASRYEVIGVPSTSLEGRNLRPVLNSLAAKGTRLHGVAMTKMEEMQSIRWNSVASTSWISPQRFGDTIVWTGKELKRYPKKYKDIARKRHRTLFQSMDLDAEKIAADDPTEVLRLSIKSWQKFEDYINKHQGNTGVVTPLFPDREDEVVETPEDGVDTPPEDEENLVSTPRAVVRRREQTEMLPVMGLGKAKEDDEDSPDVLTVRSESARVCDSCFLAEKCPGFEAGANCLYNIPVQIRTREQVKALRQGMMEMQTQRVMFMRMAEEIEGGYADPNLTKEMTVLNGLVAAYEEAEREGFSISINARGNTSDQAGSGMFSRLFGKEVGQQVQQIEGGPVEADDIIEAEVIKEYED